MSTCGQPRDTPIVVVYASAGRRCPFGALASWSSLLLFSSLSRGNQSWHVLRCARSQTASPRFYRSVTALSWITPVFVCAFGCSVLSLLFDHLVLHHHRFQWIHREESLGKGLPEHSPRVGSVPRSIFEVQSRITTCQVTWTTFHRACMCNAHCALTPSFTDWIICLTTVVCRVKFARSCTRELLTAYFGRGLHFWLWSLKL